MVLTAWDSYYDEPPTIDEERFWQAVASTLNHREALVLEMRFGRRLGYSLTLRAVGSVLKKKRDGRIGLTGERARQIESKALRALRRPAWLALLLETTSADTRYRLQKLREGTNERG
jgi:DNA-directed RNA polymerase sigma subunit (sigma70/sigma32)